VITILLGNRLGDRDVASRTTKCVAQNVTLAEEKSPDACGIRTMLEIPERIR
jgi:hypothetical protein